MVTIFADAPFAAPEFDALLLNLNAGRFKATMLALGIVCKDKVQGLLEFQAARRSVARRGL
jgi:hypothetical protein